MAHRGIPVKQHLYPWLQSKRQWISQQVARLLEDNKPKNSIASLDGVRALACLSVITYHLSLLVIGAHIWKPVEPFTTGLILSGASGVTLFFVLSGFLLFLPYAQALLFERNWPSAWRFYLRRFFRIVPAYYAALFLIILLFPPQPTNQQYLQPAHTQDLLLFLLFFMDSTKATNHQINGPFWTLAIEWQYYLLLPLLMVGMAVVIHRLRQSTSGQRCIIVACCLLGVIVWGVYWRYWGYYFTAHPTATFLLPRCLLDGILFFTFGTTGKYLEDFAVGMLISLCYIFARNRPAEHRFNHTLRRLSPWLFGAGIVALVLMSMWVYNEHGLHTWPLFDGLHPFFLWSSELSYSLSFGLCVIAILFGSPTLQRPFVWSLLRWIGLISYSLYMWHLPLLLMYNLYIGPALPDWNPVLAYSMYWLWLWLIIIPISFLSFIWIEKPWIQLGTSLLSKRKDTSQDG